MASEVMTIKVIILSPTKSASELTLIFSCRFNVVIIKFSALYLKMSEMSQNLDRMPDLDDDEN